MKSVLVHKDIFLERTSNAPVPHVGFVRIFRNLQGKLVLKDESGCERELSGEELHCLVLACTTKEP